MNYHDFLQDNLSSNSYNFPFLFKKPENELAYEVYCSRNHKIRQKGTYMDIFGFKTENRDITDYKRNDMNFRIYVSNDKES